jgi:hypothetical protein
VLLTALQLVTNALDLPLSLATWKKQMLHAIFFRINLEFTGLGEGGAACTNILLHPTHCQVSIWAPKQPPDSFTLKMATATFSERWKIVHAM